MTALLDSSRKSCQTSPHREKPTSFSFKGKQNHLGEADKSKVGRREETGSYSHLTPPWRGTFLATTPPHLGVENTGTAWI